MAETQKMFPQDDKLRKSKTTTIGSVLIIISALLPCLDVFTKWIYPAIITMKDSTGTLFTIHIWLGSLYCAPLLIIIAVSFKPNPKLYLLPIFMYFYSAMIYFAPTFGYHVNFLKFNSILTAVCSLFAGIAVMFIIRYIRRLVLEESTNDEFLEDVKAEFQRLKNENNSLKDQIKTQEKDLL